MTAWTVDLAWRLSKHYPNADDPLQMPAIVLIDELDLHLHPWWQREIRDSISELFPRIQFIATAHSPLLAQSYLDLNLVVVREEDGQAIIERDSNIAKTWRIDEVVTSALYDVDSAYSPEIGRALPRTNQAHAKEPIIANGQDTFGLVEQIGYRTCPRN